MRAGRAAPRVQQPWAQHPRGRYRGRYRGGIRRGYHCAVHVGDKPKAAPGHGLNDGLRLSGIANGAAGGLDTAGKGRVRDKAALPNAFEQLVTGDQAIAVFDQIMQQIEHLRFDRANVAAMPQFVDTYVQFTIGKPVNHVTCRTVLGIWDDWFLPPP